MAKQTRLAQLMRDEAVLDVTVGGSDGQWMKLLAAGYGVFKIEGESDASLRIRLRNIEDQLTRPAIKAVVDELLDEAGSTPCRVAEWWENDVSCWCDGTTVDDGYSYCDEASTGDYYNVFFVFVPLIGVHPGFGASCDDEDYCDDEAYAGVGGALSATYDAIIDEVERVRASCTRWWLVIDFAGDYI